MRGELLAQPAGVGVERARARGVAQPPERLQQLVLGEHALGVDGQVAEQRVLALGQLDGLAGEQHHARAGVDLEVADADELARLARRRRRSSAAMRARSSG